jgi:hypothetical protein
MDMKRALYSIGLAVAGLLIACTTEAANSKPSTKVVSSAASELAVAQALMLGAFLSERGDTTIKSGSMRFRLLEIPQWSYCDREDTSGCAYRYLLIVGHVDFGPTDPDFVAKVEIDSPYKLCSIVPIAGEAVSISSCVQDGPSGTQSFTVRADSTKGQTSVVISD